MVRLVLAGALTLACTAPALCQVGPGPQPQPPFTGGTLSQPLILTPSTTGASGLNVAPGVAPTAPNVGDLWATSSGLFTRFGGVTTGPITGASGTTGQIQTNNSGALAGITLGGDCTFTTPNVSCTKTDGVPFAASATTDATNAANISSGVLAAARGGAGTVTGALKGNGSGTVSQAACNDLSNATAACSTAIGTSGATIPLLNGGNTFSGLVNFTSTFQIGGNAITWPGSATTVAALNLTDQTLTGGANVTSDNLGTPAASSTQTIDCGARPTQYLTNNAAFTLNAPGSGHDGSCIILVTNGASAGTITFPTTGGNAWSVGASTGDSYATTNGNKYSLFVWQVNGTAGYRWAAHQ